MKLKAFVFCPVVLALFNCSRPGNARSPVPDPICVSPAGLKIASFTQTDATLNWTAVNGANGYDFEYRAANTTQWTSSSVSSATLSVDIGGLVASTNYEWRVRSKCNTGSSDFSGSQFTTAFGGTIETGLADQYPGDANIQSDPAVIFVEKFDDGLPNVLNRYDDKLNTDGMTLESDVPAGSVNAKSIKMTSITGGVTGGGHLFKKFTPGFDSTVFVRYYVKYPAISKRYFHHESVWFGGYNPATTWPNPQAGTCGLGDSRISIAYEPVWQNTDPPGMDTYIYWGDMKQDAQGNCWGNVMVTEGAIAYGQPAAPGCYPVVSFDEWMCVEVMLKLNNPVSESNGEMAVWVNGTKVGHWGPGFPKGHWDKDKWYNNPQDPSFPGFRWRTDPQLNINWLWLEYYHENKQAPSSYMQLANLVMATSYIGPIKK